MSLVTMTPQMKRAYLRLCQKKKKKKKKKFDHAFKGAGYHINYPIFAYFRLFFFYTQDEAVCV